MWIKLDQIRCNRAHGAEHFDAGVSLSGHRSQNHMRGQYEYRCVNYPSHLCAQPPAAYCMCIEGTWIAIDYCARDEGTTSKLSGQPWADNIIIMVLICGWARATWANRSAADTVTTTTFRHLLQVLSAVHSNAIIATLLRVEPNNGVISMLSGIFTINVLSRLGWL